MEQLVLTARVTCEEGSFVARLEPLSLEVFGSSEQQAQDELIQVMRAWIETHDRLDDLGDILAKAGFPGVEEDTELQLEFVGEIIE